MDVSRLYTVNGLNQYLSAGPATFSYDPRGNLTSDGATTFTYDVQNRLISATGGRSVTLSYDPLGRLYQTYGSASPSASAGAGRGKRHDALFCFPLSQAIAVPL